ncbi:response regulator [Pontibacter actiniarum]|uniref:Response regulator n=1 Tax=Pontibacter actiniarum TaxID=323450 RepID=A0A1X9YRU1_9BACT|nr:response regulator [Pontibacter actiniarum]ARS35578.1 response regulator [Pontibacter actiniarum]
MYKKVFIVDDDEVSVFLAEAMLAADNFAQEYFSFLQPADALELLLQPLRQGEPGELPNVLFLDLNMPFMSGWDFLDALTPYEGQLQEHCRIYILTSSVDADEMKRAQSYPFLAGFLHKPLEEAIIKKLLKQA